jgi:hypothetical protein
MLAEKFFLFLETLISGAASGCTTIGTETYPDGSPNVRSRTRFVPIKLPDTRPAE